MKKFSKISESEKWSKRTSLEAKRSYSFSEVRNWSELFTLTGWTFYRSHIYYRIKMSPIITVVLSLLLLSALRAVDISSDNELKVLTVDPPTLYCPPPTHCPTNKPDCKTRRPIKTFRPTRRPVFKPTKAPIPWPKKRPSRCPVPTHCPTDTPMPSHDPTTPPPTHCPTDTPMPSHEPTTPPPTHCPTDTPMPSHEPTTLLPTKYWTQTRNPFNRNSSSVSPARWRSIKHEEEAVWAALLPFFWKQRKTPFYSIVNRYKNWLQERQGECA